jgi:hypothetical protein
MNQITDQTIHLPTGFKNPFLKEKVSSIDIKIAPISMFHKKAVTARVWFSNGSTDGIQDIKGDDLLSVMNQIETFLNSL